MDIPAVTTFTDAARTFSASANATAQTGVVDASVLLQLNALPPLCAAAIDAIQEASSSPEAGDAVSSCEVLLALCSDLGDALLAQQPSIESFVVPADMPQMVVLEMKYGDDAFSHQAEFEANNPDVLGLVLIPAGTTVRLRAATSTGT